MRKSLFLIFVTIFISASTNAAIASQPYSIKFSGDAAQYGNSCQSLRGAWICIAEVQVFNKTSKMINPRLTAQFVDSRGRKFTATDSREDRYLTGVFANAYVNPSESVGWAIHVTAGPNVRFKEVQIFDGRKRVATLKYGCATTIAGAFC